MNSQFQFRPWFHGTRTVDGVWGKEMLADKFVNEAHFAAVERLLKARDFCDLQHQREELARMTLGIRRERNPCLCGSKGPKNFGALPLIRPVMPLAAEVAGSQSGSAEGLVVPLPLLYIAWRVRNCALPAIELIELPLPWISSPSPVSVREWRRELGATTRVVELLHEVTEPALWASEVGAAAQMNAEILCDARKAAAIDVFEQGEKFEFVNLSTFELSADSENSWANAYARHLSEAESESGLEFYQRRIMPLFFSTKGACVPSPKPLVVGLRTFVARRREIGMI
jgi:hypothetical protein